MDYNSELGFVMIDPHLCRDLIWCLATPQSNTADLQVLHITDDLPQFSVIK